MLSWYCINFEVSSHFKGYSKGSNVILFFIEINILKTGRSGMLFWKISDKALKRTLSRNDMLVWRWNHKKRLTTKVTLLDTCRSRTSLFTWHIYLKIFMVFDQTWYWLLYEKLLYPFKKRDHYNTWHWYFWPYYITFLYALKPKSNNHSMDMKKTFISDEKIILSESTLLHKIKNVH